jgi:hypothetical protein
MSHIRGVNVESRIIVPHRGIRAAPGFIHIGLSFPTPPRTRNGPISSLRTDVVNAQRFVQVQ